MRALHLGARQRQRARRWRRARARRVPAAAAIAHGARGDGDARAREMRRRERAFARARVRSRVRARARRDVTPTARECARVGRRAQTFGTSEAEDGNIRRRAHKVEERRAMRRDARTRRGRIGGV